MAKYNKSEIGDRAWNAKIKLSFSRGLLDEAMTDALKGDGPISSIPFRLKNLLGNLSDIAKLSARYSVDLAMKADDIDPMHFALTFMHHMEDDSVILHARLNIANVYISDLVQHYVDSDATGSNMSIMVSSQVTLYPETDADEAAEAGLRLAAEVMNGWHLLH